ncbi:MAG: segregation and condensation protein A [Gammaproteobacteria bacterium]|nr:segregation and condensation protein A [Gammaproteobacteria bacterium]MDD2929988.1 segregation and condensation protein A [Sideroxydans sp.]MDD5471492.1 segregation and condensation protein A [Sideroxydans sp.]
MSTEELSKEQQILRLMRKTLGSVVRDATPLGGRPNPLSGDTIQDIKDCFALISERERELAELLGFDEAKPYYDDGNNKPSAQIISLIKPAKH